MSGWIAEIVWLRPLWLALVPLAALAGLLALRGRGALGDWDRVLDDEIRAGLARLGRIRAGGRTGNRAALAGLALVALALAGPARPQADSRALRALDGIILAVDLSPALTGTAHLDSAVTAARLLTLSAGARPVGLVVYADEAFVGSALTTDAAALGETLQHLDAATLDEAGAPCAACGLALAGQMLTAADVRFGDIVLITGEATLPQSARKEVADLARGGAEISILSPRPSVSHAALLAEHGAMATTFAAPEALAAHLRQRRSTRMAAAGFSVLLYRDYGRYLLLLTLFPALWLLWRRA